MLQRVHPNPVISEILMSLPPYIHDAIMIGDLDQLSMHDFRCVHDVIGDLREELGDQYHPFLQVGALATRIDRMQHAF